MRKPSSPLRRVLAVVLSLLILPWQQPALALADPPSSGAGAAFNSEKPREALDALDRKLDALLARIKTNELKTPELTAALPEDLVKLKGEYKTALDKYVEAEKTAIEPAKSALAPLITASTGQLLVEAIVENDLGGIRKELAGLVSLQVSFQRPPAEIPAGDWAAIEKAAPDFQAALGPLSFRIEKARMKDKFAVAEVEDGYRPLALALNSAFLDLRASAMRIDVKGLLAAKPQTVSGDAAGALMAEVARALPKDKAALLKPQLAAVNARLAGYLHSGNPADLTAALGEIDRLYDAAQIKDKNKRAELFEHIGQAAQARAQEATTAPKGTSLGFEFSAVAKKPGIDSIEVPLEVAASAPKPDVKSALAAWVAEGQAAAGPAWDALRNLIPETADPAVFMRNYALNGLAELSSSRAAALKTEHANDKVAKALTDAYALIETKVTAVVMGSPDRSKDPAPAGANDFAAYEKKWAARSAAVLAELKKLEAEFEVVRKSDLDVTGSGVWGWSEAVFAKSPALVSEADAKTLVAPRARAKALVDLIRSLREQHEKRSLDLTNFTEEG
ncbi:MAG: hypothetical protein ABL955_10590, partial [Elusimicrobiota bacterium]